MKNIAMGCASCPVGKRQVHGTNLEGKPEFATSAKKELFMELMADSAKAVAEHFGKRITYINVLRNISVDCDCVGIRAHAPTMKDIGILATTDLLAIDQAACDRVFGAPVSGEVIERIKSRHVLRQLSAMLEKKMGKPRYELITVKQGWIRGQRRRPGCLPRGAGTGGFLPDGTGRGGRVCGGRPVPSGLDSFV